MLSAAASARGTPLELAESQHRSLLPALRKKYKASREPQARRRSPCTLSLGRGSRSSQVEYTQNLEHSSSKLGSGATRDTVEPGARNGTIVVFSTIKTLLMPTTPEAFVVARNLLCLSVPMSPSSQESPAPLSVIQPLALQLPASRETCYDGVTPCVTWLPAPVPSTNGISSSIVRGTGILLFGLRDGVACFSTTKQDFPVCAQISSY